jgi:hypothetical protein
VFKPQQSRPLRGIDHAHGDAILDRAAWVQVLDLGEHIGLRHP